MSPVTGRDIDFAHSVYLTLGPEWIGDQPPMSVRLSKTDAWNLVKRAKDLGLAVLGARHGEHLTMYQPEATA